MFNARKGFAAAFTLTELINEASVNHNIESCVAFPL
jgi:hypothetical protein